MKRLTKTAGIALYNAIAEALMAAELTEEHGRITCEAYDRIVDAVRIAAEEEALDVDRVATLITSTVLIAMDVVGIVRAEAIPPDTEQPTVN